ncbi:MAG: hypothetical protein LC624_04215, partial [Halobacteriales archaeon]|nr:hypothetical protein [Halobacteriales archaeon]
MLRPAPMSKLTIIAAKGQMRPIVEQLYTLRIAHLVEFSEGSRPELQDFRIGKPMPEGQAASDRLVRLRGLQRHLELETHEPATRHPARDIDARLDETLHSLELSITGVAESKQRFQQQLDALTKEEELLQPLSALPLKLEDYTGYQNLQVLVGRSEQPIEPVVLQAAPQSEVFEAQGWFAVFTVKEQAPKAAEAISRAAGSLVDAPKGQGTVPERIDAIARERQQVQTRLKESTEELARLRERHADWLIAAEEHLTIQAEKADAPLSFATTEHAFVVECWVASTNVEEARNALTRAVGDNLHFEVEAPAEHGPHGHEAPAQGAEANEGHTGPESDHGASVPPTVFNLSKPIQPFQMFTEMVSVPRHDEIDPTTVLALVLPVFLGFMIGDAGYGILMLALGILFVKRFGAKMPEARDIGIALALSGAVALLFGAVVFADAFGIPLGIHEAGMGCADVIRELHETTWGCIAGQPVVIHPLISKLQDIGDLLIISVLAAFVHMALGLVFGVVNAAGHRQTKHIIAKVGWFALMVGFFSQILYMAGPAYGPGHGNRIANAVASAISLPHDTIPIIGVPFHV